MATIVSWKIVDEAGKASNCDVVVQDGLTLAQYNSWASSVTADIQALCAGRVADVSVRASLTVAGIPEASADADSVVENKALFIFRDAGGFVKRITIPAVDMTQVAADHSVNTGVGSAGESFLTNIVTGDGTVIPQSIHGDDITAFEGARLYVAKDRGLNG